MWVGAEVNLYIYQVYGISRKNDMFINSFVTERNKRRLHELTINGDI